MKNMQKTTKALEHISVFQGFPIRLIEEHRVETKRIELSTLRRKPYTLPRELYPF